MKNLPDFSFETSLFKKGYDVIAGVDEVGRGCFAGPVVAGCVIFGKNDFKDKEDIPVINDSKLLTAHQRERVDKWIRANANAVGIGSASVAQINKLGIKKATEVAFRKAIKNTDRQINYLLIDAFYAPYVKGLRRKNQKAIIKGDTKSLSIAAASIVAKVYRDNIMTNLGVRPEFKKYMWHQNKGYGTRMHREIILKHGITRYHRRKFVESTLASA